MNEERLRKLYLAMWEWDRGDAALIQHFAKVHSFAKLIGGCEGLDERTMYLLEAEAYIHDIGILPARAEFGSGSGKFQEKVSEGPVREMLGGLGFDQDAVDRVAYVVCRHHSYDAVDGQDYRILIEADFLVNLFEEGSSEEAVRAARERVFRTETGKRLLDEMFLARRSEKEL